MYTAPSGVRIAAAPATAGADLPRDSRRSTPGRGELESYGLSRRPPLAQRSVKVGKVAFLEGRLFGEDGCLRRGLTDELVAMLLGEINELRHDLGWLALDLSHHHIWPSHLAS